MGTGLSIILTVMLIGSMLLVIIPVCVHILSNPNLATILTVTLIVGLLFILYPAGVYIFSTHYLSEIQSEMLIAGLVLVLIPVGIFILFKFMNTETIHFELKDGEEIVVSNVPVNYFFSGIFSLGGGIRVTNERILFKAHAICQKPVEVEIPLNQIAEVIKSDTYSIVPNVIIRTKQDIEHKFIVQDRKRLISIIESHLPDKSGPRSPVAGPQLPAENNTSVSDPVGLLVREGRYNEALEALIKKPPNNLTLADYNLFLEIYLQSGDFIRAELILSTVNKMVADKYLVERVQGRLVFKENQVSGGAPPAESLHPVYVSLARLAKAKGRRDFASQLCRMAVDCILAALQVRENQQECYELAVSFENEGETESALELYQALSDGSRPFQEAAERYKKLKVMVANTPPKAADQPQARKYVPAPARPAIGTGIAAAGQTIGGRYELRGNLGEGAMGVVYEAWDRQSGRQVAVKRMHAYLKEYPAEYGRFRKEAEIVGRLRHPNIVCIHELLEYGGEIYLVFDYIPGKTLYDVLKGKNRFGLRECKDIFNGVCDAVHYAHKNNVIHRDLKPANIMLASPTHAMVMDFGLASELREGLTRVTHQTMSGTPAFMAPEQHAGTVKRESDIYAMGVCLYEMITGVLPFEGFDSLKQKKLKNYREATAIVSWLPTGVDDVISRALEPEPSQRYADALDFWYALKDL